MIGVGLVLAGAGIEAMILSGLESYRAWLCD